MSNKEMKTMALQISNIPVLKGKVAEEFIRKAKQAEKERGTINMSSAREEMKIILSKAKL